MKNKVVLQEEVSDCGVACLLSIIRYYGGDANLEMLRIESNTTNKGVTAYDLIECAKKNGFNAQGIKDKNLLAYKLPCVIHLQINNSFSHFVVLYEIKDDLYKIMDPAVGMKNLKKTLLEEQFTGNIILLEPHNKLPNKKNENVVKTKIKQELLANKKMLVLIVMLNLSNLVFSIISSFYVNIYKHKDYLIFLLIFYLFINILVCCLRNVIAKRIIKLEHNISFNLFDNFISYIFSLPLKYLHLKDPGEIVKRADEIAVINEVVINSFMAMIVDVLLVCGLIPMILAIEYSIFFIIVLFFLISTFISLAMIKKLKAKSRKYLDKSTDYNNTLIDLLYGLTSIKHSKSEACLKKKLLASLEEKNTSDLDYTFYYKNWETFKTILASLLRLIINIFLLNKVYLQEFSFEMLIVLDLLLEILLNSLSNILNVFTEMLFIKNLINKANDFYNIPLENTKKSVIFKNGPITIKYLSYSYYNNHPLLKELTTNIKVGEKVIIKGESGSGKSTFCKILYREIDDYQGNIYINNVDIRKINLESYHNNVAYSSQYEKIFSGTIRNNILLGRKINDERLSKIIKICKLDRIIDKKTFGLDTYLYSGGEELSGGERQLILLARALVNEFQILILDETLSEVNDTLEDEILKSIFEYYHSKTIIYISHKNKKEYFKRTINV